MKLCLILITMTIRKLLQSDVKASKIGQILLEQGLEVSAMPTKDDDLAHDWRGQNVTWHVKAQLVKVLG